MKLSIIIPVYNEISSIQKVIEEVKKSCSNKDKEIIIVDDYSTDGTRQFLENLKDPQIKVLFHSKNMGKGACINTAKEYITGDIVIIQDADLEYSPQDWPSLIKLIEEGYADVVYGSRFLGPHRVFAFWHYFANKFLTFLTNILYDTILTDMETGYKAFKAEVLTKINIKSKRFDFEPEITAKIFKKKFRVYEVPITYRGRTYKEGKKITWKDAFWAIWALIKYRITD